MKIHLLCGLLLCSLNFFGQSIEKEFVKFIQDEDLTSASVGFSMMDMNTGKELFGHNQEVALMPASSMKLITTATALEILGANHTFQTKLLLNGSVIEGVLKGDIIIRGEGDPTLGSQAFLKHYGEIIPTWTAAIHAAGITKIEGKIIGDGSFFEGSSLEGSTAVRDIGNYYGAGAHALSAYENKYSLSFRSGSKPDELVEIMRTIPPHILDVVELTNEVRSSTINKDLAYIHGIPDCDRQVAKGTIPMNKKSFKIKGSIPDPAKFLAMQLTRALEQQNIAVSEQYDTYTHYSKPADYTPVTLTEIHSITSPPLSEIVNYTNLKSNNSFANILLKHLGKKQSNIGTFEAGVNAIHSYWQQQGVATTGWFQEDGSGLSRANAITALQLTQVIAKTSTDNRKVLKAGLKDFGKSDRRIITKSGYMNRVRSFAGYMTLKNGEQVAFTIIANNFNCSASAMRKKIEALMSNV